MKSLQFMGSQILQVLQEAESVGVPVWEALSKARREQCLIQPVACQGCGRIHTII